MTFGTTLVSIIISHVTSVLRNYSFYAALDSADNQPLADEAYYKAAVSGGC